MRTLRPYAPAFVAAALVALFSWPVAGTLRPILNVDGAWQIGLRQALHDGLDYGPDLLFTYGPLGFLQDPLLVYPWSARLAFAWSMLMHVLLAAALLWALRAALGSRLLAVIFAIPLAVMLAGLPELVITFIGAVALVSGRVRGRWAGALAFGIGVLAGVSLLAKLNAGVTLIALGAVAVIAAPAPRRALIAPFAAGAAVALAIGWAATGQSLGAVDDYLSGALGIVSGYSEAMIVDDPQRSWQLWAAALLAGVGLAVAWRAADALPRGARLGLVALWAVLAFTSFKAGFVRQDHGHPSFFFSALLGGLVAFAWAPHRRQTAWLLGALFALALLASSGPSPRQWFTPLERTKNFVDQVQLLSDGSATNAAIDAARRERAGVEQLDGRFTARIGRRAVHVEPSDAGLVWSQRLRWRPVPVFQSYSAYTEKLDELNADAIRSPDGPEVIMRESGATFDARNPVFDSPAAIRAMLCHFRTAEGPHGRWLMLERSAPRCGPEHPLQTVKARLGAPVRIPDAPDRSSVVVARIDGIQVSGLEKLRAALYKARRRDIAYDGGGSNRLIPGTAADGLVLRVPPRADFPPGFALNQPTTTINVRDGDRQGDIRVRFSAMSIR